MLHIEGPVVHIINNQCLNFVTHLGLIAIGDWFICAVSNINLNYVLNEQNQE